MRRRITRRTTSLSCFHDCAIRALHDQPEAMVLDADAVDQRRRFGLVLLRPERRVRRRDSRRQSPSPPARARCSSRARPPPRTRGERPSLLASLSRGTCIAKPVSRKWRLSSPTMVGVRRVGEEAARRASSRPLGALAPHGGAGRPAPPRSEPPPPDQAFHRSRSLGARCSRPPEWLRGRGARPRPPEPTSS